MRAVRTIVGGTVAAGVLARRAAQSSQLQVARLLGSSIAAPQAASWITDFLNAAYGARPAGERDVDDLRLAMGILTTRWHQRGTRLGATDVAAFHRAFAGARFLQRPVGTLDRAGLMDGAATLLGDWFPAAWQDDARRGWGIAFPTVADRDAYDPQVRARAHPLGRVTPPLMAPQQQVWHTYDPCPVPDAAAVLAGISRPETWPDYGSALGRFTALRPGGLAGQTFEIEVMAQIAPRVPTYARAHVTATRLETTEDPAGLDAWVAELNDGMASAGRAEPQPVPDGATPLLGLDLTSHDGHFMGRAVSRIALYEHRGVAWLRDSGVWDDMPFALERAYRLAGHAAQRRFWAPDEPDASMLHQMGVVTARHAA
jgi:hypothetical protein